jgi:hypothetical protein
VKLTYGALDLTAFPYAIEFGFEAGAPQNVSEALALLLQDGEVEISTRASNRTMQFNVLIEGGDLGKLADAEAALVLETDKPLNLLTLDPEDFGAATVYETFRAQVALVPDDDMEMAAIRRYSVTVRAYPFARSQTPFVSVGVAPGGSTTTTLDTCGSATGWTGAIDGASATPTYSAGPPTTVGVSAAVGSGSHTARLEKTYAATTSSTNLLVIDWLGAPTSVLTATGDGVSLVKYAEGGSPTSGYTRTWFAVAAPTLAIVSLTARANNGLVVALAVDNVAVTDVAPAYGTSRQQLRTLVVPGSVATQGSLAIESETAALGDVLSFVYPNTSQTSAYSPPLRRYRISGNAVTPDSAKVSGNSELLNGSVVSFQVPIASCPAGLYLLMGRLATGGGGTPTITYSGKTVVGGVTINSVGGSRLITTTTAYQNFALGRLQLPTIDLSADASTAGVVVQIDVQASTGCTYDELWLFNMDLGTLVSVTCGTGAGTLGGSARRLFIEPATVDTPRPTVRMGHNADRSDSRFPVGAISAWQAPRFAPDQASAFVVTSNATDAAVDLSGYARWHTYAAS